jgi:hypothetical protein
VAAVRAPGQQLAEAAIAGDPSLAALLAPTVQLEAADGTTLSGPGPVGEHLIAVAAGARISDTSADQHACAVQLVDADGVRQLHRYFVRQSVVERIVLQ